MSHPDVLPGWEPRRPALVAAAVFVAAMLALCWPMFTGQYLYGSDQQLAGYAFRHFGAEYFKAHGSVPLWNPYIFGGLPFVGAMHGDIFYPAAWLRLVMAEDLAMTLAYAIHFVIAGAAMYAFLRALGTSWTASVAGGVAYQMSGILATLVSPGHDGKLFVSSLAPFFFLALLRAIRDGRTSGFGWVAILTGLCLLSPHYQLTYYLLVAGGFWSLYLVFLAPDRRPGLRWPVALGAAAAAVLLGLAISAIQALPFLANMPWGARGTSGGWEYATGFSMPIEELATTVLPQFNGILDQYWGRNFFKLHSEYLGVVVVLLAVLGVLDRRRGRLRWALLFLGGFFLLIAFGGHTPFYRLWYEVMPLMKKVRAPGMAFFLVAFVAAAFAAFGVERLERRDVPRRTLAFVVGGLALLAVAGATGLLQALAGALATEQMMDRVAANASALQGGAVRMLLFVALGGTVAWLIAEGRLRNAQAAGLLVVVTVADLWSIDRRFFRWDGPASVLFAEDPLVAKLKEAPAPWRVMDLPRGGGVYQGATLMAWDVAQVFGYHGNELGTYDALWGGKNIWSNLANRNLWELYAVGYLLSPQPLDLPGFRQVAGPATTAAGMQGILLARDTMPPYARVLAAAAKVPDDQLVSTVTDARFPVHDIVLYPDSASVAVPTLGDTLPARPAVTARVPAWQPGKFTVALDGAAQSPTYLIASENWHPDWRATVDGQSVPVHRANQAMLSVVLPPGAREAQFEFTSPSYRTGRLVTWMALLAALALIVVPTFRRRGAHA